MRLAVDHLKRERRIQVSPRKRLVITRLVDSPMDGRDYVLVVSSSPLHGFENDDYSVDITQGILKGAGKLGIPILIAHAHGFEHALPTGFLGLPLKGILLLGHFSDACLKRYVSLGVPAVLVDQPPRFKKLGSISVNNFPAAYDATRRLVEAGHRRIAFVRRVLYHLGDIDPDSKERTSGYLQALKDARISTRHRMIFNVLPEPGSPAYTMRGIFEQAPAFTAVVCADELIAAIAAREAAKYGRNVPGDLNIVCFQRLHSAGPFSGPSTDFRKLGLEACLTLASWSSPAPRVRIPCVWRESRAYLQKY